MMKKWALFFCVTVLIFNTSIMDNNGQEEAPVENLEKNKLELKHTEMEGVKSGLKKSAEIVNRKAPYVIDELTTLLRQEADGLTLTTFLKLGLDKTQYSIKDIEKFKEVTIVNRCKLANLHGGYKDGIVSVYDYIDINNKPLARVVINEETCSN